MPDNVQNYETNGPVIKGSVKVEKPRFGKRIVNFLFTDRLDSIGTYLVQSILGPDLRSLVFRLGSGALQMALFGGNTYQGSYQGGTYVPGYGYQAARRDPIPYNNMANPGYYNGYNPGYYAQPQPGIIAPKVDMSTISFDTRDDAWLVIDRMNNELKRYQRVRVADFYTFSGVTGQEGNWALQGTGWYSLEGAHPMMRTDGRWVIDFPPIQNLR